MCVKTGSEGLTVRAGMGINYIGTTKTAFVSFVNLASFGLHFVYQMQFNAKKWLQFWGKDLIDTV